jgi:uncharacterized integral membrane protein
MADRGPAHEPGRAAKGTNWRRWGLWIALAILLLFMALNSQEVEVDLILGSATMPLIFALLIAAVLGALVGWAAPRLMRHRRDD